MVQGLGFRVEVLGFRVLGLGFKVTVFGSLGFDTCCTGIRAGPRVDVHVSM
jgi:hypothetical protein